MVNFANLLEMVAQAAPNMRIRFSTSHPKDMLDDVLYVMAKYDNICDNVHLPVQSGNTELLEKMNRNYSREWYLDRIAAIKRILPNASISSDFIAGFCTETEEQHRDTITLMEEVAFDFSYMYYYSERPGTLAEKKMEDDVPEEVKKRRLNDIIQLQQAHSLHNCQKFIGQTVEVLIEGSSKKSDAHWKGRNSQSSVVIFPKGDEQIGDFVNVFIETSTTATLIGKRV